MAPKDGGNPTQGDEILPYGIKDGKDMDGFDLDIGNDFQDGVWKFQIQGTITLLAYLILYLSCFDIIYTVYYWKPTKNPDSRVYLVFEHYLYGN